MKNTAAVILVTSSLLLAGCCTTHHATQWEYQTITVNKKSDAELNQLGKDGWEVVGFTHEPEREGQLGYYSYVLKRKVH